MAERKRLSRTVRPLRNGQITIPVEFRRELDITGDSLLEMTVEGAELRVRKIRTSLDPAGSPWLAELYQRFAPVRQEAIDAGYSEQDINDAIDEAIMVVRHQRD